ncbi:hypothetical protein NL676_017055 [Syzygium grande]|nr:hypothetical protein NL676_017055 [Syzygium grande]
MSYGQSEQYHADNGPRWEQASAASKPLVLWLNGGPGCSSFGYGAFIEHGPFKVKGGGLVENEYSWNKVANLLYLESPAGVGFSYSTNQSFYKDINDIIAAQDSLVFLQHWFAKFPQYKGRDFFIAGESYAGHYVPQLARLIVKSKVDFNLKAIAIGNPLLDYEVDMNMPTAYFWSHGIISDRSQLLFQNVCNLTRLLGEIRSKALTFECAYVLLKVAKELADTDAIDQYDILADLCLTSGQSKLNIFYKMLTSGHSLPSPLTSEDLINYQSFLDTKDPCEEQDVIKYFNRKDVQIALHAKLVGVRHWNTCNYDINENYRFEDQYISMIPILGELVKSGLRVLVYSGDLDAVIPFLGTRTMINTLATKVLKLKTTLSYRAWFTSKQVAGYTQDLPGQPRVSFSQYAGYITVDEKQQRALFYYFAEAEANPDSKPLVLWLNGGPGCSSIGVGAFCEHGPFKPSGYVLLKNDYSWNKEANMLYLESPAGVGFSYSVNTSLL